jgi:hypothetical protein
MSTGQRQDDDGDGAKKLKPVNSGVSSSKGGGDPRARVGRTGVLGIVSGYIIGRQMGFGYDGFPAEVDDLLASVGGQSERLVTSPGFQKGGELTGGRSTESVQQVFKENMPGLRYLYNRRLRKKPLLEGKITLHIAVNEFGRVVFAQTSGSTMNDTVIENDIVKLIKRWNFGRIDKPGDVTKIKYPLVFAPVENLPRTEPAAQAMSRRAGAHRYDDPAMLAAAIYAANDLWEWQNIDFYAGTRRPKPQHPEKKPDGSAAYRYRYDYDNRAYMKELTGKTDDDYKAYLKIRADYIGSPAFYFDMADWFYTHGDRETALRVLTSNAELELENATLYRLLGYRLKEYMEYGVEKFVCRKVARWRPMEPQSHRDYALALADNGEAQAALDSLCSLLEKRYTSNILKRNYGFGEVLVTDINHLIAENPGIDTSKIDERLRMALPVDLRVVLNWNMNSTDIDLYVTDPYGSECFYNRKATGTGGRLNANMKDGYGPEQFLLKNAPKGAYQIYVGYSGDRQVASAGPSVVMVEVYLYAGGAGKGDGKDEKRWVLCRQLSGQMGSGNNEKKIGVAEIIID